MEWWMIIWAAVTHSNLKKFIQISLKNRLQFLAMPISTTTDAMAEIFSRYYVIIKKLTVQMICESDQNWQNSEQSFK